MMMRLIGWFFIALGLIFSVTAAEDDLCPNPAYRLAGTVNALAIYREKLYAAGNIDIVGDARTRYAVVVWEPGSGWRPVPVNLLRGDDDEASVNAMVEYDNKLFLAGNLSGSKGNLIAIDDTNGSWGPDFDGKGGPDITGKVNALTVYKGMLVVGGRFEGVNRDQGFIKARNIAALDRLDESTVWRDLGGGVNEEVRALAAYIPPKGGEMLIAGGSFTQAGTNRSAQKIAAFHVENGSWNPLFGSDDSRIEGSPGVFALTVVRNLLIAGGQFKVSGAQGGPNLAEWNGEKWSAPLEGCPNRVTSVAVCDKDGDRPSLAVAQRKGNASHSFGTVHVIGASEASLQKTKISTIHALLGLEGCLIVAGKEGTAGAALLSVKLKPEEFGGR